jgi:hypothetical protein
MLLHQKITAFQGLFNTVHMHLKDDLDQAENNTGRVTTLNKLASFPKYDALFH